ncbi:leukocyte-associated immunoglobulin-like receptor 1 [Rhynchonycteris naso]
MAAQLCKLLKTVTCALKPGDCELCDVLTVDPETLLCFLSGVPPSIRAEPGSVISRGWPVTIVCQGPAGADKFRLEKKENVFDYKDQGNVSQLGSQETEARFLIPTVTEDTAGPYRCLYHLYIKDRGNWSSRSETLELKVTDEDVSTLPSVSLFTSGIEEGGAAHHYLLREETGCVCATQGVNTTTPSICIVYSRCSINACCQYCGSLFPAPGLPTVYVYIIVGVSVTCVLCLLLLVLLLVRRQHQKKHGTPYSKGDEQRPQERLSPAVDITESTPGDELPEKNKETHSPSPIEGDTQEVTYAQLDKRTLTLSAARAVSPKSPEPTADSSLYATLARC